MTPQTLTDELYEKFVDHSLDFDRYLFLESHDKLVRHYAVKGSDPTYTARLDGAISRFGTVSLFDYEELEEVAAEQGYNILFMEDPSDDFAWRESLNQHPGVEIESNLDGRLDRNGDPIVTIGGFLPFQVQALNVIKGCERGCYIEHSTGTGKTVVAEGTILLKQKEGYDLTIYVNKPGNLANAQRKLKAHTGLDSTLLVGTPKRREKIFAQTAAQMQNGEQPILITTAEKFREDTEFFKLLVEGHKVLTIIDEAPTKFANRSTALYRAAAEVFYTSFVVPGQGKMKGKKIFFPQAGKDRPAKSFFLAMSATSLRNSPEDLFNVVRFYDSRIFGSVNDFNNHFVSRRDDWGNVTHWKNLDLMGMMYSHVAHYADKYNDPKIAAQFPEILPPETLWCDMQPLVEKLYAKLQNEYANIGTASMLDFQEILAGIGCLQMIVDNPRSVLKSAKRYEFYLNEIATVLPIWMQEPCYYCRRDEKGNCRHPYVASVPSQAEIDKWHEKHSQGSKVAYKFRQLVGDDSKFTDQDKDGNCVVEKMLQLRAKIDRHQDKVIVFTDKNDMVLPYIAEWFDKWDISYVQYHGELSPKQRDEAQQRFRTDPEIKVFLSTDAGQDSIDLPEASLTIHYNDPWTEAGKIQRGNRQHRIDSFKEAVQEITLQTPFTVEDRKAEIIQIKSGLQKAVRGAVADQAEKMSKNDYLYMLTGQHV